MSQGPGNVIVHRILVVEDDREEADFLKTFLEFKNYEVEVARDGGQAQTAFTMHTPDAVVLDVILPHGVSGFEVCDRMKREHPDIPVIILSAIDMVDARDLAQRVGADAYISKPYDPDKLIERIQMAAESIWARTHLEGNSEASERVPFTCPSCQKHLRVAGTYRGRLFNCPRCGKPVLVPRFNSAE